MISTVMRFQNIMLLNVLFIASILLSNFHALKLD